MKKKNISAYYFYVLILLFISCNKSSDPEVYEINDSSFLVLESTKGLRNQEIVFELIGTNDEDFTSLATFLINDIPINGNSFSSAITGIFDVKAQYNLAGTMTNTPSQTFEIFIPKRKVLIEDYTGTWCVFCPRMTTFVEEAMELTEYVSVVSIHGNSIYTSTDPFTIDEGMFLKDFFEVPGYPWGIINRDEVWDESDIVPQIIASAGIDADVSIGISSRSVGTNVTIDVKVISESLMDSSKLVVFLLEDGILYDQANAYDDDPLSPWFEMGDPIVDFQHDQVLIRSLTDPLGDAIPVTAALNEIGFSYTATLLSSHNMANLSLVVMVVEQDNTVRNSQFSRVGENKAFE